VANAGVEVAVIERGAERLGKQLSARAVALILQPMLFARAARRSLPPLAPDDAYWLDDYRSMGPVAIPPAYASGRWARPRPPVADVVEGGTEEE
jgi:hypothetical protein